MNCGNLSIQYGDGDTINILGQSNDARAIERFELSDGSFMTSDDMQRIIQEVNAYAIDNGVCVWSNNSIQNNESLMQIVSSGWQSA